MSGIISLQPGFSCVITAQTSVTHSSIQKEKNQLALGGIKMLFGGVNFPCEDYNSSKSCFLRFIAAIENLEVPSGLKAD